MVTESVSSELENFVVVPWQDLPDCLTEKILERLQIFDYMHFGAVCRRWRSIQTAHRLRHAPAPPPMVNQPWFIPKRPKQESVLCSVGLFHDDLNDMRSKRRLHIPLSPTYLDYIRSKLGKEYRLPFPASWSLPYGWLLFDDLPVSHSMERGCQFTLLNPINGFQIQLPALGSWFNHLKVTMSPPPRCDIFAITLGTWGIVLHLYRQGNTSWNPVDYSHIDFKYKVEELIGIRLVSTAHYNGKFYCFFLGKGLMVVDVDRPIEDGITGHCLEMDQSQLPKVGLPWEDFVVEDRFEIFLVESNGKMLLISTFFFEDDPSNHIRTLERFELHEADLSNRRWVKAESLGDQSLFIYGDFVASLLAADVGVKENCIYILDLPTYPLVPWSVFDFGTGMVADALLAGHPLPSTHLMFVPSIY